MSRLRSSAWSRFSRQARAVSGAFSPGRRTPVKTVRRDLEDRTVVFTGGTDGMGLAAVMLLAEMHATMHVLGRDPAKTRRVADAANGFSRPEA